MNSVARARALSVRGSNVESVRVANDMVNILLVSLSELHVHGEEDGNLLQGITADNVGWVNR
jgi:hypothetical protein